MKKKAIFIICFVFVFLSGLLVGFVFGGNKEKIVKESINNIDIKYNNGKKYYVIKNEYEGEYDYQKIFLSEYYGNYEEGEDKIKLYNTSQILSYNKYSLFCEKWNLEQKYDDNTKKYMVVSYASYGQPIVEAKLANVNEKDGEVTLYLWENIRGSSADIGAYFLVIPVDKASYKSQINIVYTPDEYNNIVQYGSIYNKNISVDKPIIYIYPKTEVKVDVKLGNASLITTSYPKYNDGWSVIASPNGNLKDLNTNKNYYGLYYEGNNYNASMKEDGFIVKGIDTINFLEEKLEILGLNEREANEFIIYWLPKLENNNYNYIRFKTYEEIKEYMPLDITPTPDTIIRVIMEYKPLTEKIDINNQILIKQERKGYTVVEWGGSKIN